AQEGLRAYLEKGHAIHLAEDSFAFTGFEDGKVVGCAGLVEIWPGRDCAWSLLSECGPRAFLKVHCTVVRYLEARRTRRTEMAVDVDHAAGQRWAALLGFRKEGLMKSYSPDGRDAFLYAKVRNERR
ncbi:MAG: GNAT family acetyltransferase, partial [Geminicoccales bacterium]